MASSSPRSQLYGVERPYVKGTEKMRVKLDKKALFALASDTRVEILQALQPMRRTVTQLAEELGIDKAAVHRHLQKLVEGDLVKRYDDHGFVYYGLCWKTRDILNPTDNTKIIILLSSSIILLMVAIAAIFAGLSSNVNLFTGEPSGDRLADGGTTPFSEGATTEAQEDGTGPLPNLPLGIVALSLFVTTAPLLILASRLLRRPKQRPTPLTSGAE